MSRSLGLDLGSRNLKALSLSRKGKRILLEDLCLYDLADKNPSFPKNSDRPAKLSAMVEVHELKGIKTHANFPDRNVRNLILDFPKLSKTELASAVRNEIENKLDYPLSEATYDYSLDVSDAKSLRVRAYCARREEVEKSLELINSSALLAESLESDLLAINEMLHFNGYIDTSTQAVVLHLGESSTRIGHIQGGNLGAVNVAESGWGRLHEKLRSLEMTYAESDSLLIGWKGSRDALSIMDNHFDEVVAELSLALEYFKELSYSRAPEKIFIVGPFPTSQIKGIEESFKLPVVVVDPFRSIEIFKNNSEVENTLPALAPLMGVAVGLALRGLV